MERELESAETTWIPSLTGLTPANFALLVSALRAEGADSVRRGRRWSLPLEQRVLLVAAYRRTNLTLRHVAGLFGVSKSAADRIVDALDPLIVLEPQCRRCGQSSSALDGTLVPVPGRLAARRSGGFQYAPRRRLAIDTRTRLAKASGLVLPDDHAHCDAGPVRLRIGSQADHAA